MSTKKNDFSCDGFILDSDESSLFADEMERINADIDEFLEEAKRETEAVLREIENARLNKLPGSDIDEIFKL